MFGMHSDDDASALIGYLATQQNAARNYIALAVLNRNLPCAKQTSSKKGNIGLSTYLSQWRKDNPDREFAASHILLKGGVNAFLDNEKMVISREERIQRINAAIDAGEIPKARDLRPHSKKLKPKSRKDGLTLELVVGDKYNAQGRKTQFGVFGIINKRQVRVGAVSQSCVVTLRRPLPCAIDDVRAIRLVPIGEPSRNAPLCKRRYSVHVSYVYEPPTPVPDEDVTLEKVLGLDDGIKRHWQFSSGNHYQFTEKRSWKDAAKAQSKIRRKKRGSKRQQEAHRKEREYQRIRKAETDRQVNAAAIEELETTQPYRVIVEDKSFKNMSASAKGTASNPGKNVAQKRGLNRSLRTSGLSGKQAILGNQTTKRGIPMNRAFAPGSSQTCPRCGDRSKMNRKTQAAFVCGYCGFRENADFTASVITRNRGFARIVERTTGVLPMREDVPTGWRNQPSRFSLIEHVGQMCLTHRRGHALTSRYERTSAGYGEAGVVSRQSPTHRAHFIKLGYGSAPPLLPFVGARP